MKAVQLAKRLRQAVQGCTVHQHGPVQAWSAIQEAVACGEVSLEEVEKIALEACRSRVHDLSRQGATDDDRRVLKENQTHDFIKSLLNTSVAEVDKSFGLKRFLASLAIDRQTLANSKLYQSIKTEEHVKLFMETHVFAVWDFMSLLFALQSALTAGNMMFWRPQSTPEVRRLIHQVVLDEDSDLIDGRVISHFEFYLEAMEEVGADTSVILNFLKYFDERVHSSDLDTLEEAMSTSRLSRSVRDFLVSTFTVVEDANDWEIAAAFAIGREQVIPSMFRELLDSLSDLQCGKLKTYLDRHIQVDGEEHGPAALKLLEVTCGDSEQKWRDAASVARGMLKARLKLWESIQLQCTSV